jgi:hypothetical protein
VNATRGSASRNGRKAWSWGMKLGKGYEDSDLRPGRGWRFSTNKAKVVEKAVEG